MRSEVILTLPLPFLVLISSTPLGSRKVNDSCIFKEGEKFPSFIHHMGDIADIIRCSNDTCLCDGSNTGYKDCQGCCCAIRERFEACDIVEKKEDINVENKDIDLMILVWAIVATTALVLVCVSWVTVHFYHKCKKTDPSRATTEPLPNSLLSGNSAPVSAPETVFPAVETVERTETDNEEVESQKVRSSSIDEPLNPVA